MYIRVCRRYLAMDLNLQIPNFAPEHSLRTRVLNLHVELSAREFALSGVSKSIKISINIIIHINSICIMLFGFTAYMTYV